MIKAVIFDMDGVLINTEPLHYQCWVEIFKERYGIDLDYEVYKPCIGSTRLHFMNLIKENYGITFENLEVMNQIMKEKKDEIIARDGFPEMPGVGQMLCCLKDAGYRLAVASSSPKPVITETLETAMPRFGARHRGFGAGGAIRTVRSAHGQDGIRHCGSGARSAARPRSGNPVPAAGRASPIRTAPRTRRRCRGASRAAFRLLRPVFRLSEGGPAHRPTR